LNDFDTRSFIEHIVGGDGGLFTIAPTRPVEKAYASSTPCPVVSNTSQANGVKDYALVVPNNPANLITFSDTTDSIYTVFYQPVAFAGYAHVQAMTPSSYVLTPATAFFFISSFRRTIGTRFNWGAKFNRKIAATLEVRLPTAADGAPDYDFMETFVSAVKKTVIKNLVDYLDGRIDATKHVIAAG
jgi:hypothetical protein